MKKYIFSTAEKRVDYKGGKVYNLIVPEGEQKKTKGLYKLWRLVIEFPICGGVTSATATAFAPYAVSM